MCISITTYKKPDSYLCRIEAYNQYFLVALKDFEWAQKALFAVYRDYKYNFIQSEIGLYVGKDSNWQDIDITNEITIKDLTKSEVTFKQSEINNSITAKLGFHATMFDNRKKAKQLAHYRYRFPIILGSVRLIGYNGDIVCDNFVLPKPKLLIDNLEDFFEDIETYNEYARIYDDLINPIKFDFDLEKVADHIYKRKQEICKNAQCTPYYCKHNVVSYFKIEKKEVKYIATVNEPEEKPAQENKIKFPVPTVRFTGEEIRAYILNEVEIIDRERLGLCY